jgi:LuxR family transcriptional regulator, maltose regulon positive regulatory protein
MIALPTHYAGRFVTVERWLAGFDDDALIKQYPAVGVLGAWIHTLRGRPALADRWGDLAEQGRFEGTLPDGSTSIESWRAILRAARGRSGLEQMRADAELALREIAPASAWRPVALLLLAGSHHLAGEDDVADDLFARTAEVAAAVGAQGPRRIALAERVLLAVDGGRLDEADELMSQAVALVDNAALSDYMTTTIVFAASARIALRHGDSTSARAALMRAQRLRPQLTYALPWFAAHTLLELARTYLALTDIPGAKALLAEANEIIRLRPGLGVLVDQARQLRDQIGRTSEPEARWASAVTAAELRLIPLLTTHLSFREIAERLYVSRNTVKAQAISLYRKLGVSSRSEAIQRAAELGLVDAPVIPVRQDFILSG